MSVTPEQARQVYDEADLLHTAEAVEAALDRMAHAITDKLRHENPLILCVLTGAIIATGKLVTRLDFPLQLDYLHATRYRGDTRGGELHWIAHPRTSLKDRVVLVVDDILDEGLTLEAILAHCRREGARKVYSAVLVDKRHDRKPPGLRSDFTGLEVEDRYVFGYGMDYHEYLRNAPGIYAVKGL
jgi:hypoxanthine phosphoribosyltransferase